MNYKAYEFEVKEDNSLEETGIVESYLAASLKEAVSHCLYTKKLSNGNAKVGPSGSVVYSGTKAYALIKAENFYAQK